MMFMVTGFVTFVNLKNRKPKSHHQIKYTDDCLVSIPTSDIKRNNFLTVLLFSNNMPFAILTANMGNYMVRTGTHDIAI